MQKLAVGASMIAFVLVLVVPACAEPTMEDVQQERQSLMDAYLPPGYGNELGQLVVYDPVNDEVHLTGLDGLAGFCHEFGGYSFDGGDGNWYWHDCARVTHAPVG